MKWSIRIQKVSSFLFLFVISTTCLAQKHALDASDIKEYTRYFTLNDGFEGEGAELIQEELASSQFVLFGELHNSQQSALFFNELLKIAAKHRYNTLIAEVGPFTAEVLMKLSEVPEETTGNLRQLYQRYNSKNNRYPIPFFKGKEDATFLATARKLNFDIWGIDQEFALAFPMLFDQLAGLYTGADKVTINNALEDTKKAWNKISEKHRSCESLENATIAGFFSLFSSSNAKAQELITAIRKSWQIYCHHENGEYGKNNTTRIAYMKENLERKLEEARQGDQYPKVLIKMGSYHTTKVKSPIGYKDVGHWVDSLASELGSKSMHIRFMRRYWQGKDQFKSKSYAPVQLFMTVGLPDQWALIDLRPIRRKIASGIWTAKQSEINEIFNHDLMLIAPKDQWVENNF